MHTAIVCSWCCSDGTGNNANKVPEVSSLDLYGNALACTCADGFIAQASTCSAGALLSGACAGAQGQVCIDKKTRVADSSRVSVDSADYICRLDYCNLHHE